MHYKCLSLTPWRFQVQRDKHLNWLHIFSWSRRCDFSTFRYCNFITEWRSGIHLNRIQQRSMAVTYMTKTGNSVTTQKLQRSYATTALLPGTSKKPPQSYKSAKTVPRKLVLRYCNKNVSQKRPISSLVKNTSMRFCDKVRGATWRHCSPNARNSTKASGSKVKPQFNSALFVSGADLMNVALVDVDLGLDKLLEDIEKVQENLKRRNIDINIYKFLADYGEWKDVEAEKGEIESRREEINQQMKILVKMDKYLKRLSVPTRLVSSATVSKDVNPLNVEATPHRHRYTTTASGFNSSRETYQSAILSASDYSEDHTKLSSMDGSFINYTVSPSGGHAPVLSTPYKKCPSHHQPAMEDVACKLNFDDAIITPISCKKVSVSPSSAGFKEELTNVITSCVSVFLGEDLEFSFNDYRKSECSRRLSTGSTDSGFSSEGSVHSASDSHCTRRKISSTCDSLINSVKSKCSMTRPATIGQSPIRSSSNTRHILAFV